jgi:hypothetical protein
MSTATSSLKRYYLFFVVLAVVSLGAILSNFALRRGPIHDAQAATDIRNLQGSIDNYYLRTSKLPQALSDAQPTGDVTTRLRDYQYQRTSDTAYELCTMFMTTHRDNNKTYYPVSPNYPAGTGEIPNPDDHGRGHQCFSYHVLPIGVGGYPYPLKSNPTPAP